MTDASSREDSKGPSSEKQINEDAETLKCDGERQRNVEGDPNKVASTASEAEYPRAGKLFFILLALALSIFLVSLDMTIIATAIPRITDEFHSLKDVGWYGTAFFLTLAR